MLKTAFAAIAALAFAAGCQQTVAAAPVDGDVTAGTGKVEVIEYFSTNCPYCKAWHDQFWAQAKSQYIDTNKIKFVPRELPVHGAIDAASFAIVRCVGKDKYFEAVDAAFAAQESIVNSARTPDGPKKAVVDLGKKLGLSEDGAQKCITNPASMDRMTQVNDMATAQGVNSTPTFLVNGKIVENGASIPELWENVKAEIDAQLGGAAPAAATPAPAEPAPAATPAPATPAKPN